MPQTGPGKHRRTDVSLIGIMRMFPDDAAAEAWFAKVRWPEGPECSACGSLNVQERPTRKPQPHRCRECRRNFSIRTGTLTHDSKLGLQVWAAVIHLLSTSLRGMSGMKLHRDLSAMQKTA